MEFGSLVPQESILAPLLFNIFLAYLFFITASDTDKLIASLEKASKSLFMWFDNNFMKSNLDKCHPLVSSNEKVMIKIGSHGIANTKCEKLSSLHLNSELSFDYHISEIWKKASRKVCALSRVT